MQNKHRWEKWGRESCNEVVMVDWSSLLPPRRCPPPKCEPFRNTKCYVSVLKHSRFWGCHRLRFWRETSISGACLTDWLSRMSVATKPISLYLAFTCFTVCLVSSNILQVILPECQRKVRQSGVLKTSRTRTCPISSMLMGSISSAGIGSQQQLPGEHFPANVLFYDQ